MQQKNSPELRISGFQVCFSVNKSLPCVTPLYISAQCSRYGHTLAAFSFDARRMGWYILGCLQILAQNFPFRLFFCRDKDSVQGLFPNKEFCSLLPLLRPLWMLRGKAPQRGLVALSAYRRGLRPLAGALRNPALFAKGVYSCGTQRSKKGPDDAAIWTKELFGNSP